MFDKLVLIAEKLFRLEYRKEVWHNDVWDKVYGAREACDRSLQQSLTTEKFHFLLFKKGKARGN